MSNHIKKTVRRFQKKYNISKATYEALEAVLPKLGYTLVEFNAIFNDENVEQLIESLKIDEYVRSCKCFTYADENYRLVFLNEDLNNEEKRVVLSHEIGHIYCEHFSQSAVIGRDVIQEKEANEFSHYLLKNDVSSGISVFCKNHKSLVIALISVLISAVVGVTVFFAVSKEKSCYGEYYITASGSKYHEKDCIFVKNKTNVERLSEEDFESGEYEPCEICLP